MLRNNHKKPLTKSEMEVMNHLWDLESGRGSIRDILEEYPSPRPAYTTIATFMRILTQKHYVKAVKREGNGKTLFYIPTISREAYLKQVVEDVKDNFFGGSKKALLSFFVETEVLSQSEIEELNKLISKTEERLASER